VAFLCSAFDIVSLKFLIRAGLRVFKIPSGEITNLPYLERIGRAKRDVLLSTGLSTLAEVRTAVNVLVRSGTPKERIVVLQCHTEYPTAARDVNLRAMAAMGRACGVRVGLSDHTEGIAVAAAAVALGAVCVEKHFTLDRSQSGPDHRASLEPEAFAELVRSIRAVEEAMGSSVKRPTPRELKNAGIVRKSIVARNPITKGEVFTEKNLAVRRPGTGMSPMLWHRILGRKSRKSYRPDDTISMRELG
jgi:sialic acid synthase SpsE